MLYRDEAIVLRTQKLGEADRIITLLTRRHGRLRAVAKGIRRTSSKFGARLEPFSYVDLQLAQGRTLDTITQVETLEPLGARLGADYPRYTAGTTMVELAERLVVEDREPALQQFVLLLGALRALNDPQRSAPTLVDSFLLRSLAVAGYAPCLDACARCGVAEDTVGFHPAAGGMLCRACVLPGSARPTAETVALLSALLTGDWDAVAAADARTIKAASGLTASYCQWFLERGLRSLPLLARE